MKHVWFWCCLLNAGVATLPVHWILVMLHTATAVGLGLLYLRPFGEKREN